MKNTIFTVVFLFIFTALLITSCTTTKQPAVIEEKSSPSAEPAQEENIENTDRESEPEVTEPIKDEPSDEPEPQPEPIEEEPEIELDEETAEEDFHVSEEVFQQTFNDVEELIKELNKIIKAKDYDTWLTYLTRDYKEKYSDQSVLKEFSEQPTLKKYGVELETLRDYFIYVVSPSRANARLNDLIFIDDTHVKAIMEINDHRVILYLLEKVNGKWKITTRDEN